MDKILDYISLELRGKVRAGDTICVIGYSQQLKALLYKRYPGQTTEREKRRKLRIKLRNFSTITEVMSPVHILVQIVHTTERSSLFPRFHAMVRAVLAKREKELSLLSKLTDIDQLS